MAKAFYTTAEIARMFNVYTTTVADWIDAGRLVAYRTAGGHRRVRPLELRGFLRNMNMPVPSELEPDLPSILIIDDDPDFSKLLKRRLAARKLQVETAESGFEGVYKIGRLRPDVVVLDIFMPGMDGIEVCEEIRSTEDLKETRVIAVSGSDDRKLREKVLAAGADTFMTKTPDLRGLAAEILKYVEAEVSGKIGGLHA